MPVYHVSQVTAYLRDMLENDYFLNDVWVQGEVANIARPGSGNCYYTLRDARASIRCAMFAGKSFGAELLSDGAAVIAHGRIGVYEQRGDVQLIVDQVRPEGMGEQELKLAELKLRLEKEGLFDDFPEAQGPAVPWSRGGRDLAERLRVARHSHRRREAVPPGRAGAGARRRPGPARRRYGTRRASRRSTGPATWTW